MIPSIHTSFQRKILQFLEKNGTSSLSAIAKAYGVSRQHVSTQVHDLIEVGLVLKTGEKKGAIFSLNNERSIVGSIHELAWDVPASWVFQKTYSNVSLKENDILDELAATTKILSGIQLDTRARFNYIFTEMINNAIDHSISPDIFVEVLRTDSKISFWVIDHGIGAFKSIQEKFKLPNELSAIQRLLKGKQTTQPTHHAGEGIYFSSKAADYFRIDSYNYQLNFKHGKILEDFAVGQGRYINGTRINCKIDVTSDKKLNAIFSKFSNEDFEFAKTTLPLKFYSSDKQLISRAEAQNIVIGLEKFKHITLDFFGIETMGQGFGDELFRVWQNSHPEIKIEYINTNEAIQFMIKHVQTNPPTSTAEQL